MTIERREAMVGALYGLIDSIVVLATLGKRDSHRAFDYWMRGL